MQWSSNKTLQCYNKKFLRNDTDFCFVEVTTLTIESFASQIFKLLDGWIEKGVTVMLGRWKGPYNPAEACQSKYSGELLQFRPSERLLRDARQYVKMYIGSNITTQLLCSD